MYMNNFWWERATINTVSMTVDEFLEIRVEILEDQVKKWFSILYVIVDIKQPENSSTSTYWKNNLQLCCGSMMKSQ